MLRFVICFLFCCALFCLLSCCWFCFVIVSPRLRYGAFLVVLLLTACVRNSGTNKRDVKINQSPLFVGDFTQIYISLVNAAWEHTKYTCLCISLLEFGVNIDIRKHENSEVLCSSRNKSPKEMSRNSSLQKHGTRVNKFHLTKCTG